MDIGESEDLLSDEELDLVQGYMDRPNASLCMLLGDTFVSQHQTTIPAAVHRLPLIINSTELRPLILFDTSQLPSPALANSRVSARRSPGWGGGGGHQVTVSRGGGGIARVLQGKLWYPPLMQAKRTRVKRLLR